VVGVAELTGTYELGPDNGQVLIKTGRDGIAARVGHDLTIELTTWSARVEVPSDGGLAAASLTASLDLGSLVVRTGSGGAKPLSDRDRRDIKNQARKILGEGAQASFASSRVVLAAPTALAEPSGEVEGTLTLNGTTRPFRFQVEGVAPGRYRGRGVLKQTDFGIKPYSGFFGALKLLDEVNIEFEIAVAEA
jgi:polyisoprenoid-binding protein YceI